MGAKGRTVEQKVAWIASRQHGVVTREQLLAAGITSREIGRRLERGFLIAVFRGVYRVGHQAPSVESHFIAAVLACGDGAVLSGRAAAYLYGLVKRPPPFPVVTTRTERRVKGVLTRRCRGLNRSETTAYRRIPITTVPRTLVDLAALLDPEELMRACHEADVRHRTKPRHVEAVLARRPKAAGVGELRAILRGDTRVTLSGLERRFLQLLKEAGLPLPLTNRVAGAHRVDCRWPEYRLTVELDSYRYHNTRYAWEQDRKRERAAHGREENHRRYTHEDVFDNPTPMLEELKKLLRHPVRV